MTDTTATPVLPVDDDRDTAGFFEAARRGELVVRACASCGAFLHLPVAYCRTCGSFDGHWQVVSGRGRLHSWTVVEHQVHPAYSTPYTIVLVESTRRPACATSGASAGRPDLVDGMAMRVRFDTIDDGAALPQWETADAPSTGIATQRKEERP